ncbi:hypothetical protein DdX_11732 [Ditylenchus destructor]|uniref:Uncharacterized protein n=1 Tax=Ditylenchus destructor TaxID=166010 RepID=A0AAD4QXY6_9BILA|nr:hypothetical protein DdX_11732 [Ditylenchus destructor]
MIFEDELELLGFNEETNDNKRSQARQLRGSHSSIRADKEDREPYMWKIDSKLFKQNQVASGEEILTVMNSTYCLENDAENFMKAYNDIERFKKQTGFESLEVFGKKINEVINPPNTFASVTSQIIYYITTFVVLVVIVYNVYRWIRSCWKVGVKDEMKEVLPLTRAPEGGETQSPTAAAQTSRSRIKAPRKLDQDECFAMFLATSLQKIPESAAKNQLRKNLLNSLDAFYTANPSVPR